MAGNWPQVFANINSVPQIVVDQNHANSLGPDWRRLDFTPYLHILPGLALITLSPTQNLHSNAAGSGSFTVTLTGSGINNTWTAQVNTAGSEWLTITSPTSPQTANGPVNYTFTANKYPRTRTATINVNDQAFAVTQAAG